MAFVTGAYDAVVVGAGHNGLVTAAYLAKAGLATLVLERRDVVGGAAVTEEFHPGFKIDTGAHAVGGLHPAVLSDLDLARHGLEMLRADPTVVSPLPDGGCLSLWRDPERCADSLRPFSQADAANWIPFTRRVATIAGFLTGMYDAPPPKVPNARRADLWSMLKLGRRLRGLGRQEMFEVLRTLPMSVAEFVDEWFESPALKGTLAATGIAGVRQGPMAAGTAWTMLHHHVRHPNGVIRPVNAVRGGIGRLSEVLGGAARAAGAEIRTGTAVAGTIVADGRAHGVRLANGDEIRCRFVVSNADPRRTLLDLVDPAHLEPRLVRDVQNLKYRGATAKVHLALGALPRFRGLPDPGQPHGAISISPSLEYLERAHDDAKYGRISAQPYLEIRIPSLTDTSLAPAGQHVMSVYVQYAPYDLADGEWDNGQRAALGDRVIRVIAEYAPGIENAILHREVLTPRDLEARFGLTEGNIYHGEMTLDQLFFMRPIPACAQYRTPVTGLYLCGAGTHPGGGVNGASGYLAAKRILKDRKRM